MSKNRNTKWYYHARSLFFETKKGSDGKPHHVYKYDQITFEVKKQFNKAVPASTIRRWAITPDKDFENRTWLEEWKRLVTIGKTKTINHMPASTFQMDGAAPPQTAQTPMQRILALKRESIANDFEIAVEGDDLIKHFLRKIQDDVDTNPEKNVPIEKLKLLLPLHASAKSRLNQELSAIADIDKPVDREILHGDLIAIKDPLARERVRQAFAGLMKLFYQKGRADEETINTKEKKRA